MPHLNQHGKLAKYGQVAAQSGVEVASPYRLIQMLMEGALDKIAIAKGKMEHNDVAESGNHISWAISIIGGLRDSLDFKVGGEVAQNLDNLYDYMGRRLLDANIKKDTKILDEVSGLLSEVKSGWDAIPAEAQDREKHLAKLAANKQASNE